jgi:hypothetical protein
MRFRQEFPRLPPHDTALNLLLCLMENELKQFEKYLLDPGSENAKDHLVFPLFQKLFPGKLSGNYIMLDLAAGSA